MAVFGAVWINAPTARYLERLQDIENFERGSGFRVTKRISSPPRLEDFDALALPDEDIEDLRSCRIGDCELKLSAEAVEQMRRTIDWSKPTARRDVESLMRQLALDYVTRYLEGGNQALAVYRDGGRPTFVANEFRSMVEQMPRISAFDPELRTYLLEFPVASLPASQSFLCWQDAQFGLKPTIRINHLVIHQDEDAIVVANKQLVCQPLLLDRARTARAPDGSHTRSRLLVRDAQPQPIGWIERLHGPCDSRPRPDRGDAKGSRPRSWPPGIFSKDADAGLQDPAYHHDQDLRE